MHSKTLFPVVAITLAFACYATPCHLRAQAADTQPADANMPSQNSNAKMSQATSEAAQMVPAQAQLASNLDAKRLQPGEQFKAVLQGKVHLKNGVELPRGTTLIGTVASGNAPQGAKSELALRFTQADLKNGQTIPIEATIVGVTPPASESTATATSEMMYNAPPSSWDGSTVQIDANDALSGIDLHSRIAGQNSGVFTSDKSNLKLGARTQLALAIGAQGTSTQSTSGPNGGY